MKKNKNKLKLLLIFLLSVTFAQASDFSVNSYNLLTKDGSSEQIISINKEKVANKLLSLWDGAVGLLKKEVNNFKNDTKLIIDNKKLVASIDNNVSDLNTKKVFQDIKDSPHQVYIQIMSDFGIVDSSQEKFFPQNNIRLYAFIKMVVESYRTKLGYNLNRAIGLVNKDYIKNISFDKKITKYINTAYHLGFLEGVVSEYSTYKTLNKFVDFETMLVILDNISKQFPEVINTYYIDGFYKSSVLLERGEVAEYLVKFFELSLDKKVKRHFMDTAYHTYGKYAEFLGDLGIVNTDSDEFFVDKNTSRADFVVMLSRIIQKKIGGVVGDKIFPSISDLDGQPYYSDFSYLGSLGYLDYLIEVKRKKNYIYPHKDITKNEVYKIIMEATNINIPYNEEKADQEFVTRGNMAQMFFDIFELEKLLSGSENDLQQDIIDYNIYENNGVLENIYDSVKSVSETILQ